LATQQAHFGISTSGTLECLFPAKSIAIKNCDTTQYHSTKPAQINILDYPEQGWCINRILMHICGSLMVNKDQNTPIQRKINLYATRIEPPASFTGARYAGSMEVGWC
jgi:hypothetical protein